MAKAIPDTIKEYLVYDDTSPSCLRWRDNLRGNVYAGKPFGGMRNSGYYRGKIAGVSYLAHRIVYFLCTGEQPQYIDHIDGTRDNNRIENLRSTNHTHNAQNRRDVLGIHWKCGKWYAQIQVDGVHKSLGYYSCPLDARAAYLRAKRNLFHV